MATSHVSRAHREQSALQPTATIGAAARSCPASARLFACPPPRPTNSLSTPRHTRAFPFYHITTAAPLPSSPPQPSLPPSRAVSPFAAVSCFASDGGGWGPPRLPPVPRLLSVSFPVQFPLHLISSCLPTRPYLYLAFSPPQSSQLLSRTLQLRILAYRKSDTPDTQSLLQHPT